MTKKLLLAVFLFTYLGALAQTTTADGWIYTLSGGNATITGTTSTTGNINIPATVDTYPVVAIGGSAFKDKIGFTGTLTIPSSVKTIGNNAFDGCKNLTGDLPSLSNVTSLGQYAFRNCSLLTGDITLSSSLTTIANYAFYGCSQLSGELMIPTSVNSIGTNAFYGCSGLTGTLTIPTSVTSVGSYAFQNCKGFTGSLIVPSSLTTISYSAFRGCTGLTSLTLPSTITTIGQYAFYQCSGFQGHLEIPNSVKTISSDAFSGCTGFTSLTISNSVTTIGGSAFNRCTGLTGTVTLPGTVTTVGAQAFSYCYNLEAVVFEENTNKVTWGNGVFIGSHALRYIDATKLSPLTFQNFWTFNYWRVSKYTIMYLPEGSTINTTTTGGVENAYNVVIGNTCSRLNIFDEDQYMSGGINYGKQGFDYEAAIIKDFTATTAVYMGKTLEDDGLYTLYLPYAITLPAEIEAYSLLNYSGSNVIVFKKQANTLNAYTPYLIRRVAGSGKLSLDNVTASNVTVTKAPTALTNNNGGSVNDSNGMTWNFLGTTKPIPNAEAAANRLYVLESNNTWRAVRNTTASGYVHSLRAFMQAPVGYSGARMAFFLDEADETTGIETIETEVRKGNKNIYTIDGRFVGSDYESLPSGLYVIDSKKVYKF